MLRMLAMGLLTCVGGAASASDLVLVSRDVSGASHQTERSSYRILEGYRAGWTSVDRPAQGGAAAQRVVSLVYFDCVNRTAAMKSGTAYSPTGSVLTTETIAKDKLRWRSVTPGTIGDVHFRQVCSAPAAVASR